MKQLSFILALSLSISAMGQGLLSPNQAVVKASIEQSVVITCSGYKLQDSTGQRYGRNNRSEFSQVYSLAVATDSGLIVPASTLQPWSYDADYDRYRSSYTPILNTIGFRQIGDSLYSNLQHTAENTLSPSLFRMPNDSTERVPQLSIYTDKTYSNGWLLWIYVSDTLGETGTTSTTAVMAPARVNDTLLDIRVEAPLAAGLMRDSIALRKPIGAVWVVPTYPTAGVVQFKVAGLTVRDGAGWQLVPLQFQHIATSNPEDLQQSTEEELTPLQEPQQPSNRKNKKK